MTREKRTRAKVLWIEDGAFVEVSALAAPVYMSARYDLMIAEDASGGIRKLKETEFEAVIVDIRIPPGNDEDWIRLSKQPGGSRLGISLMRYLLDPTEEKADEIPDWVGPDRLGVLTIETRREVDAELRQLGISHFAHKTAGSELTLLLDLIDAILQGSTGAA